MGLPGSYHVVAENCPEEVTRANGTTTTHSYDGADRLLELSTTAGGTLRSRFAYTVDRLGQRTAITETLAGQTHTLDYTYDGLLRLTGAVDSDGPTYGYSYDLAGNRTSVVEDGATTETRSYNAANQVVGWQYDDAGNLLNNGSANYSYDALNRLLTTTSAGQSRANTYNGDNVLVAQVANGTTTRYTQDLVAPLAQVLQLTQGVTTTDYVYGSERLFELAGIQRTWHTSDALGSLRQTLDNAGAPLSALHYDPWGTPESGTTPAPFGFTGEVQDTASGLVHLRARWYQPNQATFLSRDPFAGFDMEPYSLHPYQYAYSNPMLREKSRVAVELQQVVGLVI